MVNRLAIGEIKLIPPKKYAETNRMEIEQEIEAQTDERMVVNTRTLIGKIILTVRISAGDNTQSPNVAEKESKKLADVIDQGDNKTINKPAPNKLLTASLLRPTSSPISTAVAIIPARTAGIWAPDNNT